MTDIEIANNIKPLKIEKIAKKLGLTKRNLILYGNYKAKINYNIKNKNKGKLVLVTAINPTKAGNGKTTVSIGLADAFSLQNKKVCLALREPSLGPVFGMKGGATGGGYSQIVPMEDINLHFNGDFHAITSANNLLCSLIDNHIFQGNNLNIDENNILFHRCLDLNDRALREIECSLSNNATPRKEYFAITAASEIMAIMCMAESLNELKKRLGNIMVALNKKGKPVYAKQLKAENAMAILLKDCLKPNLVQTLGGTPAIVHLGPFANIAHGCNSVLATKMALELADYCITEAGFGADLGAEKFLDFKCKIANLKPDCVVLVATIKALKLNGGCDNNNLNNEGLDYIKNGICNLQKHIDTIKNVFRLPLVVTLNKYVTDTEREVNLVKELIKKEADVCVNEVWAKGGNGALELANCVQKATSQINNFEFAYDLKDSVETKIEKIVTKIYGGKLVNYSALAKEKLQTIKKLNLTNLPVIIAKTQYSLSDDEKVLGRPINFTANVRDIEIKTGAGFIVALLGKMLLMPALNKTPAAINMTINNKEKITGLF